MLKFIVNFNVMVHFFILFPAKGGDDIVLAKIPPFFLDGISLCMYDHCHPGVIHMKFHDVTTCTGVISPLPVKDPFGDYQAADQSAT